MFQGHSSASAAVRAADYNEDLTQCLSPTLKRGDLVAEVGCGTLSGTTNYLYDGFNLLAEIDQSGNAIARYVEHTDMDEPLSELRSGITDCYEADALGSITSLTSSTAVLDNTYTYDSHGNLAAFTGTVTNPFRYTGREFDKERVETINTGPATSIPALDGS
jgi:hypothetical protein